MLVESFMRGPGGHHGDGAVYIKARADAVLILGSWDAVAVVRTLLEVKQSRSTPN